MRTFDEHAELILLTRWKPFHDAMAPEVWRHLRGLISQRIQDLVSMVHFNQCERDIIAEGDAGIFKLAAVIRPAIDHPTVAARYMEARVTQDTAFLDAFEEVLRQPAKSRDPRVFVGDKMFFYMNWFWPLLNPELDYGLITRTIEEIHRLAEVDCGRKWSLDGVRQDLKRLGLLPREEDLKFLAGRPAPRVAELLKAARGK